MRVAWIGVGCVAMVLAASVCVRGQVGGVVAAQPASETAAGQPATAPATQPADSGSKRSSADKLLDRMLRAKPGSVRPLEPLPDEEATSVRPAKTRKVAPEAGDMPLKREGDMLTERVGRLQKVDTGWEFHFEADGRALNDPPMILLPNSELAKMEAAAEKARWDLRFRVTGMITAYQGRNYLLVEKARAVSKADED